MDLYRINLNLLIALNLLLKERSVTAAAKKLFITQAAMSNNLQQLRQLFKDELLTREKNYMVLTQYAQEIQPKLNQVLSELQSLITSGKRFTPESSDRVFKIGLFDYMTALLLPALASQLQKQAPHIKISVTSNIHLGAAEPFESGTYDLAIGKIYNTNESVHKQLLFKDKVVCILNPRHRLAKKNQLNLQDYLSCKHASLFVENPNFPTVIEQTLAKLGHERDSRFNLPFLVPIFKLIKESDDLIGTVIERMALTYRKNYRYVIKPLPFKVPEIEFYMAWHRRYDEDLGHRWLRNAIATLLSY